MMRFGRSLWPLLCLILLSLACSLADESEVAATMAADVAATVAAIPTQTPFPTHTSQPTYTPLPTYTPAATFTPLPTHTPFPSNTPPPAPAALLAEDFDGISSCFDDYDTGTTAGELSNGAYHIFIRETDFLTWSVCEGESFDDFHLSVDVAPVAFEGEIAYGVAIRGGDDGRYEFLVNSAGGVCIRYRDGDGVFVNLTNSVTFDGSCWIFTSELVDTGRVQSLQIEAAGSLLRLRLDGEVAAVVRDVVLESGAIYLLALSFDVVEPVEVVFDNLLVVAAP